MRIRSLSTAFLLTASLATAGEVAAEEPLVVAQAEAMQEGEEPADSAEPVDAADLEAAASIPQPKAPPRAGIEEIVIRAGESESVADYEAADSVTGFDAADLEALGAQTIEDLASYTPNLEIVTSGATTPTFFIRGVGLNDFNANSTGAVAIYQDDVVINSPALQLGTLYDMEAVNVLRGPQGTGLARNASAGAIRLYTRKPSGEYGSFLRATGGNYDYLDFEGAIEAPVYSDLLSTRLAFRYTQRDGFADNGCAAPDGSLGNSRCGEETRQFIPDGLPAKVNDLGTWAARGTLRFQPTLDMDWLLGVHGARRDELSRLGQAIGTGGSTCFDGDLTGSKECDVGFPPRKGSESTRTYGAGADRAGYKDRDIEERQRALELSIGIANGCELNNRGTLKNGLCANSARDAAKKEIEKELVNLDQRPYRGDYNVVGPTTNDTWGGYLSGDIALPKGIALTTVTGYDTYDRFIETDLDQSPNTLFEITTDDDGWQFAQDVRLAGMISEQIPLRWEIGGWWFMDEIHVNIHNELFTLGITDRDYTQNIYSAAGFLSAEWDFSEKFTLDGGFRWNYERKVIDYVLFPSGAPPQPKFEDTTWQAPTGTVRLTYAFREGTHAYWKYTRGWKPGHYNATASTFDPIDVADPETIDAFETGMRGAWFEGRLGLDLSIFYYSYEDYQLFTVKTDKGENPEFVVINASDAEVYGAEVDLVARPLPGTFINLRASWLESQFIDFVQQQFTQQTFDGLRTRNIQTELNNTGNRLLNSPQFKVSLAVEQSIPLGRFGALTARYDMAWTDDTYFDATEGRGRENEQGLLFMPENAIGQPAYFLHNLWLGYRPPVGNVEIAAWVRNLTDEVYQTFAFDASNFTNTTIHYTGTPRTYGLTVNIAF